MIARTTARVQRCLLLLLLLSWAAAGARAAGNDPTPAAKVAKPVVTRLRDGVRLVVLPEPNATSVAVDVFFLVGRADEGAKEGINALIARAWGGESENRSAALLRNDIARVGSLGTDFGSDWMEIWSLSSAEPSDVRKSLQTLLTNLVANPLFSPAAITEAIEEQRAAIALAQDDPITDVLDRLRARAWGASPYGLPPLGTGDSLALLRPDEVTTYYYRNFRPERCVIAVTGSVDPEEIKNLVEKSLGAGGWDERSPAPPAAKIMPDVIPLGLRDQSVPRRASSLVFATGWLAPGTDTVEGGGGRDGYAAFLLLDTVMGGGKASRLFRALRDTTSEGAPAAPVGYDVRTQLLSGRAQSLWIVYIVGDTPAQTCREALRAQVDALATGARPVSEEEMIRARTYLKAQHLRERQRLRDRASGIGWAEVMGLGADFDTDFDTRLDSISTEDVNRFARRLFRGESASVSTLLTAQSPQQK
jgi:predicted Zn-dependent peptidase